ncbi:4a-hydroxytetrahydrobiopterin dehydratase [Aeromicrobium marinum DSM 15272]|uniref:Putative pterin-4-alpha-carbinolamine dehydratase n=1 Tax=Aeromicrobium marinum DSM 15272 TaxID=585531 RepID=E2SDQ7_9ACTN|nr:4a-hydroxytetrahydrobiopterin dehydratase [Aeromicrobium marinum]EFQ82634.1 4a-hydroxytetrahydrobiopterin dehydratase [Aeromicrobium marinum DSM 15272]
MGLLDDDRITAALTELDGWQRDGDAIAKTFTFSSFGAAMAFMAAAAPRIDEMDHHPEWSNVYDRVTVRLSSHDAGGITERDVTLATVLEQVSGTVP